MMLQIEDSFLKFVMHTRAGEGRVGVTAIETERLGRRAFHLRMTRGPTQGAERDLTCAPEGTMSKSPAPAAEARRGDVLLNGAPGTSKNN